MQKNASFTFLALLMVGLLPSVAGAQGKDVAPGQLVKGHATSSVYYVDEDLTRHAFPNEHVFKSWYKDFDGVVVTDDETLAQYPLAGLVPYKAATRLVKVQTDPKVYAVDDGGELRWVKNERVARGLFGERWADMVDDLADSFFANYSVGDDIEDEDDFNEELDELIEDISETLHAKRLKRLKSRGASSDDFENKAYGRNKVAVCHSFGDHGHTIYIAKPALRAHLGHGDVEGRCEGDDHDDDDETDTTAPVISDLAYVDITDDSATVEFGTDEPAKISVYYSSIAPFDFGTSHHVWTSTFEEEHSIALADLKSGTEYLVIIKAWDEDGNRHVHEETSFTTTGEPDEEEDDYIAPIISDLAFVGVTTDTATVELSTDEDSTVSIYFTSISPFAFENASSVHTDTFAVDHSVELTGLEEGTTYYVVVKAHDAAGNTRIHDETDFTTASEDVTDPTVTALTVDAEDVGETTAVVSILADEEVTATVFYSTTTPVDTETAASVTSDVLADLHEVELTGLVTGTTYYVWVEVEDAAGNTGTAGETDFLTHTPDVTAPVVDPLNIVDVTFESATVSLIADEDVTVTVFYSLTDPVDTGSDASVTSEVLSMTHDVALTGLAEAATYYVIVEVEDEAGNVFTSSQLEFTTEVAI